MKIVKKYFPNLDPTELDKFHVNINEFGQITIKGVSSNAAVHTLFDDNGNLNERIPGKIKYILGEQISNKGLREQLEIEKKKNENIRKV